MEQLNKEQEDYILEQGQEDYYETDAQLGAIYWEKGL
jgi:hypothetical protein